MPETVLDEWNVRERCGKDSDFPLLDSEQAVLLVHMCWSMIGCRN